MFKLYAGKTQLTVRQREPMTSGSVNVYEVEFQFAEDWDGLDRTAVFRAGHVEVPLLLDDTNRCMVPWEVLADPERLVQVGVNGKRGGALVLPTIWANLGTVLEGTPAPEGEVPPTPELWQQELAKKGDNLTYDGLNLNLRSGEKVLSTVQITGGGGEGGGPVYNFGHGLKQEGLNVSVDTVDDFSGDNTLPMTAAGVLSTVGNIEALLSTI